MNVYNLTFKYVVASQAVLWTGFLLHHSTTSSHRYGMCNCVLNRFVKQWARLQSLVLDLVFSSCCSWSIRVPIIRESTAVTSIRGITTLDVDAVASAGCIPSCKNALLRLNNVHEGWKSRHRSWSAMDIRNRYDVGELVRSIEIIRVDEHWSILTILCAFNIHVDYRQYRNCYERSCESDCGNGAVIRYRRSSVHHSRMRVYRHQYHQYAGGQVRLADNGEQFQAGECSME